MLDMIKMKIEHLNELLFRADCEEIEANDPRITGTDYMIHSMADAYNMAVASIGLPKHIEVVCPYVKKDGRSWEVTTREYHISQIGPCLDLEKYIILLEKVGIVAGTKIGQLVKFHGDPTHGIEKVTCAWTDDDENHEISIDLVDDDWTYAITKGNNNFQIGFGSLKDLG